MFNALQVNLANAIGTIASTANASEVVCFALVIVAGYVLLPMLAPK